MTTVTMPYALTGDTYVRSDKIEGNFNYIKQFFNGYDGVGISSTNLSSTLTTEQIAESHSLSYITITGVCEFMAEGATVDPAIIQVPVFDDMTLRSVSLNIQSTDGAACQANVMVDWQDADLGNTVGVFASFDSSKESNPAITTLPSGTVIKAGATLVVSLSGYSTNVDIGTATICFSHKHTSK